MSSAMFSSVWGSHRLRCQRETGETRTGLAESVEGAVAAVHQARRQMDMRTFGHEKNPRSARESGRCWVLSCRIGRAEERKTEFSADDITKYFKQAGFPLPGAARMTLVNAKNAGYLDAGSGRGTYKLNPVGHNLVAHSLPPADSATQRTPVRANRKRAQKQEISAETVSFGLVSSAEPDWDFHWRRIESARSTLSRTKSVNVNKDIIRNDIRELVQEYFRSLRPTLVKIGLRDEALTDLDRSAQELLRLASGRNLRSSYLRAFRELHAAHITVETERELMLGHATAASNFDIVTSGVETQILTTLHKLVPSAGLSYEQALRDLRGAPRISYRGTAVELREALREVLDHLAPDADVM